MNNLVDIENISVKFINNNLKKTCVKAVDNVSLKIYPKEVLGLVGESGCGKSTLGRAMLNLVPISQGNIYYKNKNIHKLNKQELKEFRKEAQLIFQNPYSSLNPKRTIYETLKEPFIIHKEEKESDEIIVNIIKKVGLDEKCLKNYPHEFSGGQRQRIAIARSILLNPKFIVADEAVSALDVNIKAQIINLLIDLKNDLNLTYLFISHDLNVVKYISDRIAVMYLGEIVEIADTETLFSSPSHPYTKILLNAIPQVGKNRERISLKEELPLNNNIQDGCKFVNRCQYAQEICKIQSPETFEVAEKHQVKCHLYKPSNEI